MLMGCFLFRTGALKGATTELLKILSSTTTSININSTAGVKYFLPVTQTLPTVDVQQNINQVNYVVV